MRVIRVAALEGHPALRAGIEAILRADPGLSSAGIVAGERAMWRLIEREAPDVLLLDHPRPARALHLCLRVKALAPAPGVVIYAAGVSNEAIVPAALAGADGLVDKTADVETLVTTLRAVGRGERTLPRITQPMQARAAAQLGQGDRAIFAMGLAGTSPRDIAATVGLTLRELEARAARMLARLIQVPVRA